MKTCRICNRDLEEIQFPIVLTDEGTTYLIPKEDIHSNTCINLNTTLEEYRVYL